MCERGEGEREIYMTVSSNKYLFYFKYIANTSTVFILVLAYMHIPLDHSLSVSYTHLDVYKRQLLNISTNFYKTWHACPYLYPAKPYCF